MITTRLKILCMDLLPSSFGIETDDTSIFLIDIRSMDIGIGGSISPYYFRFVFDYFGYEGSKYRGSSDE